MSEGGNFAITNEKIKLIKKDVNTAMRLLPFYYGSHGKVRFIMEYAVRYFILKRQKDSFNADVILDIMKSEIEHLLILGEIIKRLGVNINSINAFDMDGFIVIENKGVSPKKIIIDSVAKEINLIMMLKNLNATLTNKSVKIILEDIIKEDEMQVDILKNRLNNTKIT